MVCSCNNLVLGSPISHQLNPRGAGPRRAICNIWKLNKEVEQVCRNGIRIVVGNGEATLMWEDLWISNETLKCKFPRLYSLCIQKHMKINDYGLWDELTWG